MKKGILLALLPLMLLLASCGHPENAVPAVPPLPQEVVTEVQPSIPEQPEKAGSEQKPQIAPTEDPTEQEADPLPPISVEPEPEPEPQVPPLSEVEPEEPAAEETDPPREHSTLLPILMYHHVVPDGTACNSMTVTAGKLAGDLAWLAEHGYTTILPRDLATGIPLPEKPVLITFDDGYRSNYELAYPLLQQYQSKAVISIMVYMQDIGVTSFLSWEMCREMSDSGLVEIGSHTYLLHNLDERSGNFTPGGINGIQRKPEESDEDFQLRVLDDIQKSHDLIEENLGRDVTFFAYPFGIREPDAQELIASLFPVTVVTAKGTADIASGTRDMTRWTVTMNTSLSSILEA